MSQLLSACPQCECLLCAYGKALFRYEKRTKTGLVEASEPEASEQNGNSYRDTWGKCLQLREELFSHLLLHDTLRNLTVSSRVA
jgi:hypothetical protein